VSVRDAKMRMRFRAVRLLTFELLLPPTRFGAGLVSASWLVVFVHLVRGSGIVFISNHWADLPCHNDELGLGVRVATARPPRLSEVWSRSWPSNAPSRCTLRERLWNFATRSALKTKIGDQVGLKAGSDRREMRPEGATIAAIMARPIGSSTRSAASSQVWCAKTRPRSEPEEGRR
jgi:hypothetical protein